MTEWYCQTCGTASIEELFASVVSDIRMGKCNTCKRTGVFRQKQASSLPSSKLTNVGQARKTDPATSHEAARLVRPKSARHRLMQAHIGHQGGLTDEEAADYADLSLQSEYATRCSELMRAGLLADTTETRMGSSGMTRIVRRITSIGLETMRNA